MTRLFVSSVAIAASAWLGWSLLGASPAHGSPATYYVNFDRGRDSNDGRSLASAWKHAPGDPAASGRPSSTTLGPGDRVRFAEGVRYRGSITVTANGTPGKPIVFESAGDNRAIIDGSDPVANVRPCRSAQECGGATNWQSLVLATFDSPLPSAAALFSSAGPLTLAQAPNPGDLFYAEEVTEFLKADGRELEQGRATLPAELARAIASPAEARIALWVKPNRVAERPILGVEGNVARFDPARLKFYTDRPDRIAVIGHPALIDMPGEYAVLAGRRAVVAMLPQGSSTLTIANGRGGFDLAGSNIVIRGLGFENMADDGKDIRTGVAIGNSRSTGSGIRIEGNSFRNLVMPKGQGAITLRKASDVIVSGNEIDTVAFGSGMRISGPASRIRIEENRIRRIGRTGIMLMAIDDALVTRNRISDVKGVHGNGLSAYLGNHNVRFVANTVTDAKQPATFHGDGGKSGDNNILFANNLFVATPDAIGALISWGGSTKGVVIRNNVLLGGDKSALRLSPKDSGVVVTDNVVDGVIVTGEVPAGWRFEDNRFTSLSFQQKKGLKVGGETIALDRKAAAIGSDGRLGQQLCGVVANGLAPAQRGIGAELACR